MQDIKIDLRVKKNNKLILHAFLDLLKEKSFENIYISDICTKAMIHRTTFYNHFEDKYNLLNYALINIISEFKIDNSDFSDDATTKQSQLQILKSFLQHIEDNKNIYLVGLKNFKGDFFEVNFKKIIVEAIIFKLKESNSKGVKFSIPIPLIAEFYYASLIGFGIWWLQRDINISIDETIDQLNLGIFTIIESDNLS